MPNTTNSWVPKLARLAAEMGAPAGTGGAQMTASSTEAHNTEAHNK